MYIKNIFNIINYKGLEDNFSVNFDDVTYIIGDNAKRKSTIGSVPLWILTGYNLFGSNKEIVSNDSNKNYINTIASMTIIDNDGREYVITRSKGKDNFVMLDGIRTTQEIIARFYKDVHAFICSYNPSYFRSLELSKQRDLLLRILPAISSEDAYNLLENEEKQIIGNPIVDIKGYCKAKREEIKMLKSELEHNSGRKSTYVDIAIQKEELQITFNKQNELENLENEYESLITNSNGIINLEDIEKDIKKIELKINKNIKEDLKELQEKHKKELDNLNNLKSTSSSCPTCKQEIKNENLIRALTITYKRNIDTIVDKISKLKEETQELIDKKKIQLEKYNIAKTPEMQQIEKRKNEIKSKIDALREEKSKVDLLNKEIAIKHKQIMDAKSKIEILEKEAQEINNKIEKNNNQLKIATRLNLLMIEQQMKLVSNYLDKVTIEFSKIDERTGEILDIYNIKYDGRDYEKLSRSYKLRADLEIAQLINKVTGINSPIFIDDAESITDIDTNLDSQIIISIVVKYNELEILYSYSDVLQREKISINKKIQESCNLLSNAA